MPIEENLFLNTLTFDFPQEPATFYFSMENRTDCALTKLNHALFPKNIFDIFPNITNSDTLYTSFTRQLDGFLPLEINFTTDTFALVKRFYNREIKHYFTKKDKLVEPTFIKDNQIWLKNTKEKAPKNCVIYDRYTKSNLQSLCGQARISPVLRPTIKSLKKIRCCFFVR
jgi:hypothetical protein